MNIKGELVKCIDGPLTGLIGRICKSDEMGRLRVLFNVINHNCIVSLNSKRVMVKW